jgi:hypothetical protein
MQVTRPSDGTGRADGVVVAVDPVNRELTVRFADGLRQIHVPPGCPVTLRGERVRLRLVQARDHVRVTCVEGRTSRVASLIEVRSGSPPAGPPARGDRQNPVPPGRPESHPSQPAGGTFRTGQ